MKNTTQRKAITILFDIYHYYIPWQYLLFPFFFLLEFFLLRFILFELF